MISPRAASLHPSKNPSTAKREREGPSPKGWEGEGPQPAIPSATSATTPPQHHVMHRLQSVFREVFDNDDLVLHPEMTAADIPAWDSLTNINLIIATEIAFGIRLKPREISALANVGDMVEHISSALRRVGFSPPRPSLRAATN